MDREKRDKKGDEFIKLHYVGKEAFDHCDIKNIEDPVSYRSGCIIGSGMGGLPGIENTSIDFRHDKKVSLFYHWENYKYGCWIYIN